MYYRLSRESKQASKRKDTYTHMSSSIGLLEPPISTYTQEECQQTLVQEKSMTPLWAQVWTAFIEEEMKFISIEEMEKVIQKIQNKTSTTTPLYGALCTQKGPSFFHAMYTASPIYEVPQQGYYSFTEDDLAAYLDSFKDDQSIGMAFSPINCMVARALSLKYPGESFVYVDHMKASIGGGKIYFSPTVQRAIELFDLTGQSRKTLGERYPSITKGEFTQNWTYYSGYPPLTMRVVESEQKVPFFV